MNNETIELLKKHFDLKTTAHTPLVVPILDAACFEVFRPMFKFIRSRCPSSVVPGRVATI